MATSLSRAAAKDQNIAQLEAKMHRKNAVAAELMPEYTQLKKRLGNLDRL